MRAEAGHDLGLHRVVEPEGALPQAARRLDATGPGFANEVVIDVETLNIDSASFDQIVGDVGQNEQAVADRIEAIVAARGKMQNPVTGSGGMLLGRVEQVGPDYRGPVEVSVGDRVATLVSLTLTPLNVDEITGVHFDADQVDVSATAYLWPSSPLVVMPADIDERVALAALDVCGAPAQTRRLVVDARRLLILGAGKSGMLCAAAARRFGPSDLQIFGVDRDEQPLRELADAGLFDQVRRVNARRPAQVLSAVEEMSGDHRVDVAINTCNVGGTEMSAILPVRQRGTVFFFNMATDFSRAALGGEGIGRDVRLLIGNGYVEGHAQLTVELLRQHQVVHARLSALVGN